MVGLRNRALQPQLNLSECLQDFGAQLGILRNQLKPAGQVKICIRQEGIGTHGG